jgi:hypothetical protein
MRLPVQILECMGIAISVPRIKLYAIFLKIWGINFCTFYKIYSLHAIEIMSKTIRTVIFCRITGIVIDCYRFYSA